MSFFLGKIFSFEKISIVFEAGIIRDSFIPIQLANILDRCTHQVCWYCQGLLASVENSSMIDGTWFIVLQHNFFPLILKDELLSDPVNAWQRWLVPTPNVLAKVLKEIFLVCFPVSPDRCSCIHGHSALPSQGKLDSCTQLFCRRAFSIIFFWHYNNWRQNIDPLVPGTPVQGSRLRNISSMSCVLESCTSWHNQTD